MKKLISRYNSFIGVVNKLAEYVNALCTLPPQGTGAKEQVVKEVQEIFRQLNGQSKSLENAIISAVYGEENK